MDKSPDPTDYVVISKLMNEVYRASANIAQTVIAEETSEVKRSLSEESEALLASELVVILNNWIGQHLKCYPAHIDRLITLLKREFPSLLTEELVFEQLKPTSLIGQVKHVRATIQQVDVNKGRKKQKLSFVFHLSGQTTSVACTERGTSERSASLFVDGRENEKMGVEVWKSGEKLLGVVELPLDGLTEDQVSECDAMLHGSKVGKVKVRVTTMNGNSPVAKDKIRLQLTEALVEKIVQVFSTFPKIENVLSSNKMLRDPLQQPNIQLAIEVTEEVLFEDEDSLGSVISLNENEVDSCTGISGNVATTRYVLPIHDLTGDMISLERRKGLRCSTPTKRLSSALVNTPLMAAAVPYEPPVENPLSRKASSAVKSKKTSLTVDSVIEAMSRRGSNEKMPQSHSEHKVVFKEEYPVADIPLRQPKTVGFKGVQWRLRWRRMAEEPDFVDQNNLLSFLVQSQLNKMSSAERMLWKGELNGDEQDLLTLAWIFLQKDDFESSKAEALIDLHSELPFNNFVIQQAVATLAKDHDARELLEMKGIKGYLNYSAKLLAEHQVGRERGEENQIHYCIAAVSSIRELLHTEHETWYEKRFLKMFDSYLREKMRPHFVSANFEDLNENVLKAALPMLKYISSSHGDFELGKSTAWSARYASVTLELVMPIVKTVLASSNGSPNGVDSFNAFITLRQVLKFCSETSHWQNDFFTIFKPCLASWTETVCQKALDQVTRVLDLERERHSEQDWVGFYDANQDWLEGASYVGGIFISCEVTWKKLDWPDLKTNLAFGLDLLRRLHGVFQFYVDSFFDIIFEDDEFDKCELAIILNSISHSSDYLQGMFSDLNDYLFEGKQDREDPEIFKQVQEFTRACQKAVEMAKAKSEAFIDFFCKEEAKEMDKYIRANNIFNPEEDKECLLGHVHQVLQFLDENIKSTDEKTSLKYNQMITKRLFQYLDSKVIEQYHTAVQKLRTKFDPESASAFSQAVDELVLFRNTLSLSPNEELNAIQAALECQSSSTEELIVSHQEEIAEELTKEESTVNGGKLIYHMGAIESEEGTKVIVSLRSLNGVLPREGKRDTYPSITIRILPDEENLKSSTFVYEKMTSVLFDMVDEIESEQEAEAFRKSHEFSFDLPPSDKTGTFLSIELFDHSPMKTHKVFRGLILTPLSDVAVVSSKDELESQKNVKVFKMLPPKCADSESLKELAARYDSLASSYSGRVEKYLTGGRIKHKPNVYTWVKEGEIGGAGGYFHWFKQFHAHQK